MITPPPMTMIDGGADVAAAAVSANPAMNKRLPSTNLCPGLLMPKVDTEQPSCPTVAAGGATSYVLCEYVVLVLVFPPGFVSVIVVPPQAIAVPPEMYVPMVVLMLDVYPP